MPKNRGGDVRRISKIIIHCSASTWGNAAVIRRWHTDPPPMGRGWRDIGYHWIILNGHFEYGAYRPEFDGCLQPGRPIEEPGAHCRGHNADSIGICLIGPRAETGLDYGFSIAQYRALAELVAAYSLGGWEGMGPFPYLEVVGHGALDPHKTCPVFDTDWWRRKYLLKEMMGQRAKTKAHRQF